LLICLLLAPGFARAVDETASNLVAFGAINLTEMTDTLNQKYPATRKAFWNVSGIAYHDFTGGVKDDVMIGLSGYQDKGLVYNGEKQLVEDTGSGFAYYHKVKGMWKLVQVELVEGKHYVGFEGADLTGEGKDQLVVYSSDGVTQIANIYTLGGEGLFHKVTRIASNGMGPRVSIQNGKPMMVDYQAALINTCEDCAVYYGRPYQWDGKKFTEGKDEYLDQVESYDPIHATDSQCAKALAYFENYLKAHPDDFGAMANCYDLSLRLGLKKEADGFKKQLEDWGDQKAACPYCDEWLQNRNKVYQQQYLDRLEGKPKVSEKLN
jgi:hypothetical protein